MRLRDFQITGGEDTIGLEINRSIGYLSEVVYLRLGELKLQAPYAKLAIVLFDTRAGLTHGRVVLARPVCLVYLERRDPEPLVGSEAIRRAAATDIVSQAVGFLRRSNLEGDEDLLAVIQSAWAEPPPFRFELTKRPVRNGPRIFRAFYTFGPDNASVEVEIARPDGPSTIEVVKESARFYSLANWFPLRRIRVVQQGIVFEDDAGRAIGFGGLTGM